MNLAAIEENTRDKVEAQYYVGMCYYEGWGVIRNKDMTIHYLQLAKTNGYIPTEKTIYNFRKERHLEFYKTIMPKQQKPHHFSSLS